MHYDTEEDSDGNIVGLTPFCSGSCHRDWCDKHNLEYPGWNGCQEGGDCPEWCIITDSKGREVAKHLRGGGCGNGDRWYRAAI